MKRATYPHLPKATATPDNGVAVCFFDEESQRVVAGKLSINNARRLADQIVEAREVAERRARRDSGAGVIAPPEAEVTFEPTPEEIEAARDSRELGKLQLIQGGRS